MSLSEALDRLQRPQVVVVGPDLFAIVFQQVKVIAARHLLHVGLPHPRPERVRVFESSSGSMAMALALACREIDVPLTVVADEGLEREVRVGIEQLGAKVVLAHASSASQAPQRARLALLDSLMRIEPNPFWCRQYDNPAARAAYAPVADQLAGTLARVDALVATVGTGASGCGIVERLRAAGHRASFVAVDTHGSVLFDQRDAPRLLRGLGNSIMPLNLRHQLVDECHWVTPADAFHGAARLRAQAGLDGGPTSGAAFLVASWIQASEGGTVAFICPDVGDRYRNTLLSEQWLRSRHAWSDAAFEPVTVDAPRRCPPRWSRFAWNRRASEAVASTGEPAG